VKKDKKIFLCCLFGIGNSVLFYPVIKNLKKFMPDSKIIIGSLKDRNTEFFSCVPGADEIITFNSIKKAYRDILNLTYLFFKNIDIVIVPYLSENRYAWLMSRVIGSTSVGYDQKGNTYDILIPLERKHELEINLDIVRALIPDIEEDVLIRDASPGIEKIQRVSEKKKVGFHTSAHVAMLEKCWPYSNFVRLNKLLNNHFDFTSYLFGGPAEHLSEFRPDDFDINLVGKLDLKKTMEKIAEMDLFVTNDSGLMHIAAGLGVPVASIFGPTDEVKNAPYVNKRAVITHDLQCRPCYKPWSVINCCQKIKYRCLKEITPEKVFEEIVNNKLL
jgi:heptosyltransferase-2